MKESVSPAKRAKGSSGSGDSLGAPSTAVYSALLTERNELKGRCEALMLENQIILWLVEEAKELRAKVAYIEK